MVKYDKNSTWLWLQTSLPPICCFSVVDQWHVACVQVLYIFYLPAKWKDVFVYYFRLNYDWLWFSFFVASMIRYLQWNLHCPLLFDQRPLLGKHKYYVVLIVKKRMYLEDTCDLRHVFTTRHVIAAAIVVVSCRTWISRGLSQTPKMAGISNAVLVQSIRSKLIIIYFHPELFILCLYENINCITSF